MNKHLKQLIDLSKLDQEIDSFEPKIEEIKKDLNLIVDDRDSILKEIENLNEDITQLKNKKGKNEAHLAELSAKLEDIGKKSSQVKNEKEAKALNLEEDLTKENLSFANDESQRFDNTIENQESKIEELQTKANELDESIKAREINVNRDVEEIEAKREAVSNEKSKLISEMDQKIITFYEKIRRWAGNSTVVEVKKQACYGCFMKLSDRVFSEVIKAEDIITCPHCGRIIYADPEKFEQEV